MNLSARTPRFITWGNLKIIARRNGREWFRAFLFVTQMSEVRNHHYPTVWKRPSQNKIHSHHSFFESSANITIGDFFSICLTSSRQQQSSTHAIVHFIAEFKMTDKLAAIKRPWPVLRFLKETLDAAFTYPTIMHVCEVGDLIGINTPGLVLSTQHAYRVECITWMHTSLVCMATGERQRRHNSRIFNINGVNKWSRSPATFEVVLPVGDNGGVSLEFFKEKIEQFANDNPGEWREVNTFDWYQLPEGHRVLIQ
jgi:hypothetical protein